MLNIQKIVTIAFFATGLMGCNEKPAESLVAKSDGRPMQQAAPQMTTTAAPIAVTASTPLPEPPRSVSAAMAPASTRSSQLHQRDLADTILPASRYKDPVVKETYLHARDVADRLDQMYCYCRCRENGQLKHKSLLTCFQSDHAAECGICLNEAKQAHLDWSEGLPIEVTLKTVDGIYNQGNPAPAHAH